MKPSGPKGEQLRAMRERRFAEAKAPAKRAPKIALKDLAAQAQAAQDRAKASGDRKAAKKANRRASGKKKGRRMVTPAAQV